jgi:hypothetical protein
MMRGRLGEAGSVLVLALAPLFRFVIFSVEVLPMSSINKG